jgi:hypothetical protein
MTPRHNNSINKILPTRSYHSNLPFFQQIYIYIYIYFLSSISIFSERQTYAPSSKDHYQGLR